MLFLSWEYWKVHYLTQISRPPPFQMAPAFSKTDVAEQIVITAEEAELMSGQRKRKLTNLDEKFAINAEVDHSTSGRYVFHHTVLLQLKHTK